MPEFNFPYKEISYSTLRGACIGVILGGGYHVLLGTSQGSSVATVAQRGGHAAMRLSVLLGGYTFLRGTIKSMVGTDALACLGAGGTVVAVATMGDSARRANLSQYFSKILSQGNRAPPLHLVVVSSFASGALTLGGVDLALRHGLGVTW